MNWLPDVEKCFLPISSNASFIGKLIKRAQWLFCQRYSTTVNIQNDPTSFIIDDNQCFHLPEVCLIVFSVLSQLGLIASRSESHQLSKVLSGLRDISLTIINDLPLSTLNQAFSDTVLHFFSYRLCLRLIYSLSSSVWSTMVTVNDDINNLREFISFAKSLASVLNENRHNVLEQTDYALHLSIVLAEIIRGMLHLSNYFMALNMKRQDNLFSECIIKLLIENEYFQLFTQSFRCIDGIHKAVVSKRDDTRNIWQLIDVKLLETHLIRTINTLKITAKSMNMKSNALLSKTPPKDATESLKKLSNSSTLIKDTTGIASTYNLGGNEQTKNYLIIELISSTLLQVFCECQHDDLLCHIISAIMDCKAAYHVKPDELYQHLLGQFSTRSLRGMTNILNLLNFIVLIEWDGLNKRTLYNNDNIMQGDINDYLSLSSKDQDKLGDDGAPCYIQAVSYYKKYLYILSGDSLKLLLKHLATLLSHGSESLNLSILENVILPVLVQDVNVVVDGTHKLIALECLKLIPLCLYNSRAIQEKLICMKQFYNILTYVDDIELCEMSWMILEFLCMNNDVYNCDNSTLNEIDKCKAISIAIGKIDNQFMQSKPLQFLRSIDNQIILQNQGFTVNEEYLNLRLKDEEIILLSALWNSYWKLYRNCFKFREMYTTFKLSSLACKCLGYMLLYVKKHLIKKELSFTSNKDESDQLNPYLKKNSDNLKFTESNPDSLINDGIIARTFN